MSDFIQIIEHQTALAIKAIEKVMGAGNGDKKKEVVVTMVNSFIDFGLSQLAPDVKKQAGFIVNLVEAYAVPFIVQKVFDSIADELKTINTATVEP